MFTLQPGQNQQGLPCQHCLKSIKKYNSYCNIASHHKKRVVQFKSKEEKALNQDKMKSIRKLTEDYSYHSIVIGVILLFPEVRSLTEILDKASKLKTTQLNSYLVNIHLTDSVKIHKYIEYVMGIKEHFPNIQESKLIKKGIFYRKILNLDLTIRNLNNQVSGIVTQKKYYLVREPISMLHEFTPELQETKKNFLEYHGYYQYGYQNKSKLKEIKELMKYRPAYIPYYTQLIAAFNDNLDSICRKLVQELTFPEVNHPVYLLDGKTTHLLSTGNKNWTLQFDNQYLGKPSLRYYLLQNQIRKYNIYIRWETNIFAEPEFVVIPIN